ncbi:lipopolysaccharide biosynthesis protein [Pseudoxanthomonas suwonensis]|uniref:lipopolysaccharide biosynthesis protein n=1 Tax=Pseudoxanthomonas suwonensis TaxID=314722 RepID=UPI0012DC69AE|nr:hypothetical protein [Pseudoxanthomonas suwonensis]
MKTGSSLRRKVGWNALSFGYVQFVTVAVQIIQVPFFIHTWGVKLYGEWLVLTGVPQLLVVLDFGMGQAAGNRAMMRAAAGNRDGVLESLQTAFAFTLCTASLVMLAAILQYPLLSWKDILKISEIEAGTANIVMLCMFGYLCLNLLSSTLTACFKAVDRTPLGVFLIASKRVVDILISISVLLMGFGPSEVAASLAVGQAISTVVIAVILWSISPYPVLGLARATRQELSRTWRPSLASMGIPVAQAITLQGGVQAVNLFGSPALVVIYSMTRTLVRPIIQAGMAVSHAMMPEVSRLYASGDQETAVAFVRKTSRLIQTSALLVYVCLAGVGPYVSDAWSRGSVMIPTWAFLLIGLHAVVNVFWYVPASLLMATNRHLRIGIAYSISSAATLFTWLCLGEYVNALVAGGLLLLIPELCVALTLKRSRS